MTIIPFLIKKKERMIYIEQVIKDKRPLWEKIR
jgi:hypothetical protein